MRMDSTSSASNPGANAGERFCVTGTPSTTNCTSYSEPRGCSTPFASKSQPGCSATRLSRPLPGCGGISSAIACRPTEYSTPVREGSSSVAPSFTCTCVVTGATPSVTETRTGTSERTSTSLLHDANPSAFSVNRYTPKRNSCAAYHPSAPTIKFRRNWLPSLSNSPLAVNPAPCASRTSMRSSPRSRCAAVREPQEQTTASASSALRQVLRAIYKSSDLDCSASAPSETQISQAFSPCRYVSMLAPRESAPLRGAPTNRQTGPPDCLPLACLNLRFEIFAGRAQSKLNACRLQAQRLCE